MSDEKDTQWENYQEEEIEEQNSLELEDDSLDNEDENEDYESNEYERTANKSGGKGVALFILFLLIVVLAVVGIFLLLKLIKGHADTNANNSSDGQKIEVIDTKDASNGFNDAFFDENFNSGDDITSVGFSDNGEASVVNNSSQNVAEQAEQNKTETEDMFNNGFENLEKQNSNNSNQIAENNEDILTPYKEQDDLLESFSGNRNKNDVNNSILVSWNKVRQNPFKPPVIKQNQVDRFETFNNVQFEIIEPPTKTNPDENLKKLLTTQISGILYDDDSPSAIVNLAGKDQFVKIGDEISGYKIKNISKTKVEISYKNNTYVASVGELFVPGKLEAQSAVSNLSNKFAGRYKQTEEYENDIENLEE